MLRHVAVAGLLLPAPAVPPAVPPAAPPAQPATIEAVTVKGSGCRKETTAVGMSPDNAAFTLTYSAFVATAGAGTKPDDRSKKCSITVRITAPAGVTFAIAAVDHRGFAHLEAGAAALHRTRYHVTGEGAPSWVEHPMRGFLDDYWQVTDPSPGAPGFGPCGRDRKLDINTEVRVSADDAAAPSMVALDSTDGSVTSTYRLVWKAC